MDEGRREIEDGDILVDGNRIVEVGSSLNIDSRVDEVVDLSNHVVLPGLVNTHHHMYQSLTRVVPAAQNAELFDWLKTLYPIWARITPEMIQVSTLVAMAELIMSGCTTSSDHLYMFPNGCRLEHSIEAANEIGMRFHAARGSMSVGESDGGLPPDSVVESESFILSDTLRLVEDFHQPERHAMCRIVVAPCSPFSVSRDLMRESAHLARSHGVALHTHLAENWKDIEYTQQQFAMTPAEYVEDLEWLGDDVWHAHCVRLDQAGIHHFARTGTGVAHCPCSNMRLASGIAPVRAMLDQGIPVGLGVDGSASNDSGHLLAEARQAMLLQRVAKGPEAMSARDALAMATLGGAQVLGRDDVGSIAQGMCADFVAYDMRGLDFAGAVGDTVAALLFCQPASVNYSIINGKMVVKEGVITTMDLDRILQRHNRFARDLIRDEVSTSRV